MKLCSLCESIPFVVASYDECARGFAAIMAGASIRECKMRPMSQPQVAENLPVQRDRKAKRTNRSPEIPGDGLCRHR